MMVIKIYITENVYDTIFALLRLGKSRILMITESKNFKMSSLLYSY